MDAYYGCDDQQINSSREDVTPASVVSVLHTYDIDKTRLGSLSITRSILVLE